MKVENENEIQPKLGQLENNNNAEKKVAWSLLLEFNLLEFGGLWVAINI